MAFIGDFLRIGIGSDGQGINVGAHTKSGYTKLFAREVSVVDDGSFDLPNATIGMGIVWTGAEHVMFTVDAAGTVTSVVLSTNGVVTDTDVKLCVFKSSTNARVRNRLGSTKTVSVIFFYGMTGD